MHTGHLNSQRLFRKHRQLIEPLKRKAPPSPHPSIPTNSIRGRGAAGSGKGSMVSTIRRRAAAAAAAARLRGRDPAGRPMTAMGGCLGQEGGGGVFLPSQR